LILGGILANAPSLWKRRPDVIRIAGIVSEHNGSGARMVKQIVSRLPVVALPKGQAQPDR
jgi:hypothetical protein